MSSIYDISYEMNGPLPFYHPDHIIHYIMWGKSTQILSTYFSYEFCTNIGKMELVHNVFLTMYGFLKQFVDEEDNVMNELPPVSFSNMLKLQDIVIVFCSKKKKKIHRLFVYRMALLRKTKEGMMFYLTTVMKLRGNMALEKFNSYSQFFFQQNRR